MHETDFAPRDREPQISLARVVTVAANLITPDNSNAEYDLAIVTMACDLLGMDAGEHGYTVGIMLRAMSANK